MPSKGQITPLINNFGMNTPTPIIKAANSVLQLIDITVPVKKILEKRLKIIF